MTETKPDDGTGKRQPKAEPHLTEAEEQQEEIRQAAQQEPAFVLPAGLHQTIKLFLATLELNMEMGNARTQMFQQLSQLQPFVRAGRKPDPDKIPAKPEE